MLVSLRELREQLDTAKTFDKAEMYTRLKDWCNLKEFEKIAKSHDWTYQYSDDHRAWKAGEHSFDTMRSFHNKIPFEKYKEIYNRYAPKDYQI